MPVAREYGKIWGMNFPQEKRVSKRVPRGRLIWGITSSHFLEFYYHYG